MSFGNALIEIERIKELRLISGLASHHRRNPLSNRENGITPLRLRQRVFQQHRPGSVVRKTCRHVRQRRKAADARTGSRHPRRTFAVVAQRANGWLACIFVIHAKAATTDSSPKPPQARPPRRENFRARSSIQDLHFPEGRPAVRKTEVQRVLPLRRPRGGTALRPSVSRRWALID